MDQLLQKTIEERKATAAGDEFEREVCEESEKMSELIVWAASVDLDALALPENLNDSLTLCQVFIIMFDIVFYVFKFAGKTQTN